MHPVYVAHGKEWVFRFFGQKYTQRKCRMQKSMPEMNLSTESAWLALASDYNAIKR